MSTLCSPRTDESRTIVSGSYDTVEEARAAVQQMLNLDPARARRCGYVTVSPNPRRAEAVGAILLKIATSPTGWVTESDLVHTDYDAKRKMMTRTVSELWRDGVIRAKQTNRGRSFTLNNWTLTEDNDGTE